MIPAFPEFKKIELSDKDEIEQITKHFPPYSDYNFNSLWSWNLSDTGVSLLYGNLVIKFNDYLTGKPFCSFLGDHSVNETAKALLAFCHARRIESRLLLIPESSIKDVDTSLFNIEEDRGNFDYVYHIDTFLFMNAPALHVKRKHNRYFEKTYPHTITQLDLSNSNTKGEIVELYHNWARIKTEKETDTYFHNEYEALLRFLKTGIHENCLALGIYSGNKLIAMSISENLENGYNICHFQKTVGTSFKGLSVYLTHQSAKRLAEQGIKYINWEQDLGILGLRENKESFLPERYLKKFTLSPRYEL